MCNPAIDETDINYCYRLSTMLGSTNGRPILGKLLKESVWKEILKARKYLTSNTETSRVFIYKDSPQIVNDRWAK